MNFKWTYEIDEVDWEELSELYKIAPLGEKKPQNLQTVFTNSRYKCFVYDDAKLIGVGRALADGVDVSYLADVAIHPEYQGKEPFYAKLGFDKMNTAMAIFKNREKVLEVGFVSGVK